MKVLTNYADFRPTIEFVASRQGMTEFEWRTNENIIALVESKQKILKNLHDLVTNDTATKEQVEEYHKMLQSSKCWMHLKIVKVDTTRKWAIREDDSATYIQYLDVIEPEVNFYGFI